MLIHTAVYGETWEDISRQYSLPTAYLQRLNNTFSPPVTGQEIIIAYPALSYTAVYGDTLTSVAQRFDTDISALLKNNPYLYRGLNAGDEIIIRYEGEKKREVLLNGYCYTFIGRGLLNLVLPYLSYITVFTYGFDRNADLLPPSPSDEDFIRTALEYGTAPLMHLSTLTAEGRFSSELAAYLLENEYLWDRLIGNIVQNIVQKGYKGVDVDFEYLPAEYREAYADLIGRLRTELNGLGLILITALAPKTSPTQQGLLYEGHDYALLGQNSDFVMPMTYEWGYAYSEPMAVAPIDSVRRVIEYAVTEVPSDKILLGLPFYGYDWTLPYQKGTAARSLSPDYALMLARQNGGTIEFDTASASPFMRYPNHIVWFESPKSVEAKMALADSFGLAGAGIWSTDRPFFQGYMTINLLYDIKKP
ncbi:MAG: LysM peptidoglycan-binding domain-containing protein [Firmicutes bacterium]|nr:LysM peptidoglycan-binding domain-containing protein [Bacillota bacterium]